MSLWKNLFRERSVAPANTVPVERKAGLVAAVVPPPPIPEVHEPEPAFDHEAALGQLLRRSRASGRSEPARQRRREVVLQEVERVTALPALNSIANSLRQLVSKEELDIGKVAETIERDPALTSRVLKVASSSYYTVGDKVEELEVAIMRLGSGEIRRIASVTKVLEDAAVLAPDFDWRCLWQHSVATGMLAEDLARILGIETQPLLNCSGLLHDIGKVILSEVYPHEYRSVLMQAHEEGRQLAEVETERFGTDHAEVGADFARRQRFPGPVIEVIACHHRPDEAQEARTASALVQIANYYAKLNGLGYSGDRRYLEEEPEQLAGWRILLEGASPGHKMVLENEADYLSVSLKNSTGKIRHALQEYFARAG